MSKIQILEISPMETPMEDLSEDMSSSIQGGQRSPLERFLDDVGDAVDDFFDAVEDFLENLLGQNI